MGKWAELISDVLVLIAKQIDVVEDYVAFGGVCKSWQVAAVKENFNERGWSHQILWLMLAQEGEEEEDGQLKLSRWPAQSTPFFFQIELAIHSIQIELASSTTMITRIEIELAIQSTPISIYHDYNLPRWPAQSTPFFFPSSNWSSSCDYFKKAVLSSRPSPSHKDNDNAKDNNHFVIMVIYGVGYLGFWRVGDKTWTTIEARNGAFCDVTYYNGKFYGVDACCRVYECDVGGSNPTVARYVGGIRIPIQLVVYKRPYIVESAGGALLIVLRDGYGIDADKLDHDDDDYDNSGTCEFLVFRLNISNGRWKKMKSLEDNHSLFLGHSASISIEVTSKFPGIKANCIYYTDDYAEQYWSFKRGGGKDMGIYNLEDGSRMPFYEDGFWRKLVDILILGKLQIHPMRFV
ncbi:hypothetical protein ACSBR1_038719 [Camellia fascicularis]